MLTNQEALDFVQEMLNAREPNVMNHLAANRVIDHQLRDLVNRTTKMKPEYWSDSVEEDGQIIFDHWNCPNCHHEYELDYEQYDFCPYCGQAIDWSNDEEEDEEGEEE